MKTLIFGLVPVLSGLLLAQDGNPGVPSKAHSWSGLLVAAGCQTSTQAKKSASTSDMRRSSPTEAGQNAPYEQQQNQADRTAARQHMNATDVVTTPKVDSVDTRGSAPLDGNTMAPDEQNSVKAMDSSCRISEQTNAFALRLGDGKLVPFDAASNAKIAQQVQTGDRLKHKTKVFRATVRGSMEGDAIRVDTIKM